MADQPKRKNPNAITKNSERKNGKANKASREKLPTHQAHKYHGSHNKHVRLSELQKALLGGGAMRRIMKPAA